MTGLTLMDGNVVTAFPALTSRSRLRAFGLFTGQLGYACPQVPLYGKGGAAVTDNRYDLLATATGAVGATATDSSRWGATGGVGLEYGFTPNWSVAVEYDHLFTDRRIINYTVAGAGTLPARVSGDTDIVTARLNYRFGWLAR